MNPELFAAFVVATTVLIIIPGPNVTFIVANSIAHGAGRAMLTVAGTQSAQVLQLAVVSLGMTSLIAVLAGWFEILRWVGVAYLLWLGIQQWRKRLPTAEEAPVAVTSGRRLFAQGFLIALTNPKVLFFLAAFFPQFIDPSLSAGLQLLVLSITYLVIATVLDSGYALVAGRLRNLLNNPKRMQIGDRIAGTLLIGAGLWLALARKS